MIKNNENVTENLRQITKIRHKQTSAQTQTLQTHRIYSTLKRRGSEPFHVVSACNTGGALVGTILHKKCVSVYRLYDGYMY